MALSIRYRVGGADNSTSTYSTQRILGSTTSVSASRPNTGSTSARVHGSNFSAGENIFITLEILNPFQAQATQNFNQISHFGGQLEILGGTFGDTTSFTGFSLLPNTGTITGSLDVYGFSLG